MTPPEAMPGRTPCSEPVAAGRSEGPGSVALSSDLAFADVKTVPVSCTPGRTQDMPYPFLSRPLSVLAGALSAAGLVLALTGCSDRTPPKQGPAPVSLPPARDLGSSIIVQVMRGRPPTPTGQCPAGSVALFGLEPNVPRTAVVPGRPVPVGTGSAATPALPTAPSVPPEGVACYLPVGTPVTITSAGVSSVTTYQSQPGPATYGFVVAFPSADVPALTAASRQAYDAGDALGMSVGGRLWQAPQPKTRATALRAEQINLLSRTQALQLHHLLVPSS